MSYQHEKNSSKRVIALNWSSAEALLALGITPVGAADLKGYAAWVGYPQMPEKMVDVGTRAEPNLELIRSLKPDLIIGSPDISLNISLMSNIKLLSLDTFRADHNNGLAIDNDFLAIAKAVNKVPQAKQVLRDRDNKIRLWKQQLGQHFSGKIPKVTLVHFASTSIAAVYGKNSSVEYALAKLGIDPAIQTHNTAWGEVDFPIQKLASMNSGVLIYVRPFADEQKLFSSILWKHMPFVQQNRFLTIEPCWTFGSVLSIERIAQATTEALLTLSVDHSR